MAGDFTPFLPAARSKLGTGTNPAKAAHFAPMTPPATPDGASPPGPGFSAELHPHSAANIEVKRDGGRISQIRIQCPCGELIELDCEY